MPSQTIIIETKRLQIRKADTSQHDVDFFHRLWTNPDIMKNVGFPKGLPITHDELRKSITAHPSSEFDQKLIVQTKSDITAIGECKLGLPDIEGLAETDVKLLPENWRKGYGTEIKAALVDYLFMNTACNGVRATPNKNNIASQKMQEAVGAIRTGEEFYRFPDHMRDYTEDVESYVYIVYRSDWNTRNQDQIDTA